MRAISKKEIRDEDQMEHLKTALRIVNVIHKKLTSEIDRKKPFKRSYRTIDRCIDSLRDHTDWAHNVTRKDRIKRDLKRCSMALIFLEDVV